MATTTNAWRAVVEGKLRRSATDIVADIATRLSDPERTVELAGLVNHQSGLPTKRDWVPIRVSFGNAGLALLFGQLDQCFPNQSWDQVAHNHLAFAARSLETPSIGPSSPALFGGLAGLCFATRFLSRRGTRYQQLLATIDPLLIQRANQTMVDDVAAKSGVSTIDYDLIGGPTGVGAYLLTDHELSGTARGVLLDTVLDRLVSLSGEPGKGLQFFVPPSQLPTEQHRERFPYGAIDCGLAHGVPGPLALLSLAHRCGIERSNLQLAVQTLSDWLASQYYTDQWGINWPHSISPNTEVQSIPSSRTAWCYGSPGVANSLLLASEALNDPKLQQLAVEAIYSVAQRASDARRIPSPILCHGIAGLLQIVLRFAHHTSDPRLTDFAIELTQQLVSLYEPGSHTGFRDVEPDGRRIDNPGFLEGSAGVALALLAASTDVAPTWDRILLLS